MKSIKLTKDAQKSLTIITKNDSASGVRIAKKIKSLAEENITGKSLSGPGKLYSLRSGNYRIIYKYEGSILVIVETIGKRGEVYRNLEKYS